MDTGEVAGLVVVVRPHWKHGFVAISNEDMNRLAPDQLWLGAEFKGYGPTPWDAVAALAAKKIEERNESTKSTKGN